MWNPPIVDEKTAARRSVLAEAADLLADLVTAGRAHDRLHEVAQGGRADVALRPAHARRTGGRGDLADRIAPYRAGYTSQQRRELEHQLLEGELLGVVATNALELGIDIGSLDAAICVTFPGTVASLRQMWGRAGPPRPRAGAATWPARTRSTSSSAAIPDEFLDRPVEAAILDPWNEQLHTAAPAVRRRRGPAARRPTPTILGPDWRAFAEALVSAGDLRERPDGDVRPAPAGGVPGRATSRCARRAATAC